MKRKALGVGFLYNQRDVILSNYPNLRSKLQELNELNTVALSQERIERKERLEKDLAKDIPKVV